MGRSRFTDPAVAIELGKEELKVQAQLDAIRARREASATSEMPAELPLAASAQSNS
jgi:hypothetical protein